MDIRELIRHNISCLHRRVVVSVCSTEHVCRNGREAFYVKVNQLMDATAQSANLIYLSSERPNCIKGAHHVTLARLTM